MRYIIETTENGCIETLEFSDAIKFKRETVRTDFGCESRDKEFADQLEMRGFDNEIVQKVCDEYDGIGAMNFLEIAELYHGEGGAE